jgi:hypothetical protein
MASHEEPAPDARQHPTHVPISNWRNPWVILASILVLVFIVFGLTAHLAGKFGPQMYVRTSAGRAAVPGPWGPARPRVVTSNASGSEVQGVITAIDGNKLTVAGNGTTSTVYTSSSTQYIGGSNVVVNDTVDVSGTTSADTFTASSISINQ